MTDDLERRLARLGREPGSSPRAVPAPPLAELLDAAGRRRVRRRSGVAAVSVAVLVVGVAVSATARSVVDDRPATQVASMPGATSTSAAPPPAPPTTMPVPSAAAHTAPPTPAAAPPTTARASTTPTVVAAASTTVPGPPAVEGTGPGLWVVGVDGRGLRQVSPDGGPITWSPDGQTIAKAVSGLIWLLSADAPQRATTLPVEGEWAACLDWSSKGELAWLTAEGDLRVSSDLATSRVVARFEERYVQRGCRWSPDGSLLAVDAGTVTVLDRTGAVVRRSAARVSSSRWGSTLTWSPDGSRLAVATATSASSSSDDVTVLDVEPAAGADPDTGASSFPAPEKGPDVVAISWNRAGTALLLSSFGGLQSSMDPDDGRVTALPVTCCRLLTELPDGRLATFASVPDRGPHRALAVLDDDFALHRTLAVTSGPRPDRPAGMECYGSYLSSMRVSPDGGRIAFLVEANWGPRCDSPTF